MKRTVMRPLAAVLRGWMVPAILVLLAALLTVPWATWVILAAYERDVNEKASLIAERVRIQLQLAPAWYWYYSPSTLLDPVKAELMGDATVQAVCFIDQSTPARSRVGYVRRNEAIPMPTSVEQMNQMLKADPGSHRKVFQFTNPNGTRRIIYVDLSDAELRKHFWVAYWPLLRSVIALTASGFIVISSAGLIAYHLWGRAARKEQWAQLAQQGLLAERVLTAAVLAHEIRNPLAALRFQLHSLRRNNADPTRVTTTAETIDSELLRIQRLVQDYLAHEKAQSMRVEPVELAEAVRGLQTLMGELLRENGTRLNVIQREAQPVVVACDPHGLRQVLMNLVINAQQAMGYGGTITIEIGRGDGFGTISVADTGPGIPPEIRDRLFKPFATSKKEGSGIGLALVKRFVDNFGGTVTLESEPGQGAKFHLKLPLVGTAQAVVLNYQQPAAEGAVP